MTGSQIIAGHPLEGCDEKECYDTMMSERTELIKARREAEDNLVKTIIQLSSALLVLLAGYAVERKIELSGLAFWLFVLIITSTVVCVLAGLGEHRYSSKAYSAQQKLVEDFYSKRIATFSEPKENSVVRKLQTLQFASFMIALSSIGVIAVSGMVTPHDKRQSEPAASSSSAAAAAAASAASAAAAASASAASECNQLSSGVNEVGGTIYAPTAAHEKGR